MEKPLRNLTIPLQSFDLRIISDCHVDSSGFDERAYLRVVDEIAENDRCYYAFNGDYIVGSYPGQKIHRADQGTIDAGTKKFIELNRKLPPERCLWALEGNHDRWAHKKFGGISPVQYIASQLNIQRAYVQKMNANLLVRFGEREKRMCQLLVTTHHGWGMGKFGAINNLIQLANNTPQADLITVSHHHQRIARSDMGCWIRVGDRLVFHQWHMLSTGMTEEGAEYCEEIAAPPRKVGVDRASVSMERVRDGGGDFMMPQIELTLGGKS